MAYKDLTLSSDPYK